MTDRSTRVTSQYMTERGWVRRRKTSVGRKKEFLEDCAGARTSNSSSARQKPSGASKPETSAAATKGWLATEKKKKGKKPTSFTKASGSAAEYFEPDPRETSQQEQDGTHFKAAPMSQEEYDEMYKRDCLTLSEAELDEKYGPPDPGAGYWPPT